MGAIERQREQATAGLEQLATLVRAQAWQDDAAPQLPPTQAYVLRALSGADAELRARQLAERLGISAASLSDSLKAMRAHGWLLRRPDPADRRAQLVRLSAQGRALAARLRGPGSGMARLVQGLAADDVAALLRLTQLLVAQAQVQGVATGLRSCIGCRFFQPFASGDPARPHVCGFIGQPFGDMDLRVDCAEHEAAEAEQQQHSHARFRDGLAAAA